MAAKLSHEVSVRNITFSYFDSGEIEISDHNFPHDGVSIEPDQLEKLIVSYGTTGASQLEKDYARAVRVLTNITQIVMNNANAKEDLDFQ